MKSAEEYVDDLLEFLFGGNVYVNMCHDDRITIIKDQQARDYDIKIDTMRQIQRRCSQKELWNVVALIEDFVGHETEEFNKPKPRRIKACGHVAYRDHDDMCISVNCKNAAYQKATNGEV